MRYEIQIILLGIISMWTVQLLAQRPQNQYKDNPRFMQKIADSTVNFIEVTKEFEQFVRENPDAVNKKNGTKRVVNHYLHWKNRVKPYTDSDGEIHYPTLQDKDKLLHKINALTPTDIDALLWRVIGPFQIYNKKRKAIGPHHTNVRRFDIYRQNTDILYCGTETGMVYKTVDKGEHWTPCDPKRYFGGDIRTVEIANLNPNKVIIGSDKNLWMTQDGGDTWQQLPLPAGIYVRDAVFDPKNDNHILAGNDYGLYESKDNGNTWYKKSSGRVFDIRYQYRTDSREQNTVYLLQGGERGTETQNYVVFKKSTDNANSFTTQNLQIPFKIASGRIGLSSSDAHNQHLYLLVNQYDRHYFNTDKFQGKPYILHSSDGGTTWTYQDGDYPYTVAGDNIYGGQGYYDMAIIASPNDPNTIIYGFTSMYRSENGGRTATNIGGYTGRFDLHPDIQELHTVGNETWMATDGGMIYSTDFFDKNAQTRTQGMFSSEFWGFDQGWNEDIIVGGRNHNGNLVYMPEKWELPAFLGGSERSTGYVFMSNERKISFSDNEGGSGVIVPDNYLQDFPLFQGFYKFPFENTQRGLDFCQDPRYAQRFFLAPGYGNENQPLRTLWLTEDDGYSFTAVHTFQTDIQSYDISRANNQLMVVATIQKLYYSTDGGVTFSPINMPQGYDGMFGANFYVQLHPTDSQQIWLTPRTTGKCYRTLDFGKTWQRIDQGLENISLGYFFLTGNNKNAAYAIANYEIPFGNQGGRYQVGKMYYYDDRQSRWTDISNGLRNDMGINKLRPFYKKSLIRIGTRDGIWERPLTDPHFLPIAQPIVLNKGSRHVNTTDTLYLDSYSIANHTDTHWHWKITPQPLYISNPTARNPKVVLGKPSTYTVSLTVSNQYGTHTKSVERMFVATGEVLTNTEQSATLFSAKISPTIVASSQPLWVTNHTDTAIELTIYDTKGSLQIKQMVEKGKTAIDTDLLPKGIMIYKLKGNKNYQQIGKFLIQ